VRCPFTVAELKDQVRSAYGRDNQSIFFHASEANTFDSHLTSSHRIRKESEEILTKFLIDDETLTIKEVPIELINWLYDYKHLRLNLIKYIRYTIKHKE
tara:strand:+ start:1260 stop:1556 length:297 start_codon:yes stop_codon:yes gene_type:complete